MRQVGFFDDPVSSVSPPQTTLAELSAKLGRQALDSVASIVTPETILRWHRELVARKFDGTANRESKPVGRPPTDPAVVAEVLRFAKENPTWGYRRIAGALAAVGHTVSHQTVKNILAENGIDPAPTRKGKTSWSDFIRTHTDSLLATDFFTTEVWTTLGLVTYYVLFFIHVGSRKVYIGGITRNPTDDWMRQAARNVTSTDCGLLAKCRYLLRDRDTKFTAGFDMIIRAAGITPLPLPARSPNLNAMAERFVKSIKTECLERMIFFGEASFQRAVTEYIEHFYLSERPHQGRENKLLFPLTGPDDVAARDGPIVCRERLGGLLKFYHRKAA
jgi:transposase InsO family protein